MVSGLDAVICGGGEDRTGIPVNAPRPHLSGYLQNTGGRVYLAYHHVTAEVALTGRHMQGPITSRNGCRDSHHPLYRAGFHSLVGPYLDGIGTAVRHYRMQVVALSQLELCGTVGKVGHERLRVGRYAVTMKIQTVTNPTA